MIENNKSGEQNKIMRTILHCDMNNFYASVECLLNPALKDFPVAVAGNPVKRTGIILAKNYSAKAFGVKTGEAIWQAKAKCPTLITVAPQYDKYSEYSTKAREIYGNYTDKIEPFGLDECWLDVTDSLKYFNMSGIELAKKIQDDIFENLGLTISIGVSFGKTLAKLGSDMKKPKGLVEINKENHLKILKSMSVDDMIFIGKKTSKKLKDMNIFTLYDLVTYNVSILEKNFGIMGKKIYEMALGINDDEVTNFDPASTKSVGNGRTSPKDLTNYFEIKNFISDLADMVSSRLRAGNFKAKTIHLDIKFADFTHLGEQKTYSQSFSSREKISEYALVIFDELTNRDFAPIRAIRISCSNLENSKEEMQISIFEESKKEKLGKAIDLIRDKFGEDSIMLFNKNDEYTHQ